MCNKNKTKAFLLQQEDKKRKVVIQGGSPSETKICRC